MEDPGPSYLIAGIALCLLVLGFTSAVDATFTRISRHRIGALLTEGRRTSAQRTVARLLDDPYRFKSTVIVLNSCATLVSVWFTIEFSAALGNAPLVISLVLLLLAILIFSETIPKALALRDPDATALALAGPLNLLATLLWPLIALLNLVTRPLFHLISGRAEYPSTLVTEEELRLLVNVGEEEGVIEHEERAMIEGVIAFGDTLLREIMVPRVDIVAIPDDTPLDAALDVVVRHGHSRIPVYDETIDRISGILYAKDLIPALRDRQQQVPIRSLLRPAHFVPETMRVNALLEDLQRRKVHMAIIVDEYGVTAGLATIEDLIEQIVGEIQDEYDTEEPSVQPIGPHEFIIDARVSIDDINELADLDLASESAERIGGLVYEQLGRVPRVGDQVDLDSATVTVLSVKGVRAQKLRLRLPQPEVAAGDGLLLEGEIHGPA